MDYNIKGTNLDITDEIRDYVEKCLGHADKFLSGDGAARANVECEFAESEHGAKYRAEFNVTASHGSHRAEARGETLHAALDIASAELTKELRQNKKKRMHVFRRSAVKVKEYLRGWRTSI